MTMERFPPPPKPSLPGEAPWREAEQLHEDLVNLTRVANVLIQAMSGGPKVIVMPGAPTPGAPTPTTTPTTPALSGHERGGVVTSAGESDMQDTGASWEDQMWQGWEVEVYSASGGSQVRRLISNTSNKLSLRKKWDQKPVSGDVYVLRPRYPMDNPNSFATFTKTVTLAVTPEQLTLPAAALSVPNGWPILLIALPDNSGDVFFALSSADALVTATRFDKLEPGKSIALFLTKTDLVWVAVETDGDGVSAYVPQWVQDT